MPTETNHCVFSFFFPLLGRRVPALLLCVVAAVGFCAARDIRIIDASDRTPLPGTTVIGQSGLILGVTDAAGRIADPAPGQYPLSIRSVGYAPTTLQEYEETVALQPAVYALNEVVVKAGERPIRRVVSFVREYATGATGSDTMQLYGEYMMESFFKDQHKKVKGYKDGDASMRVRNEKRYARLTDSKGRDSVMRPGKYDDVTLLSCANMISLPDLQLNAREKNSLAASDTIMGKYWPWMIKSGRNGLLTLSIDGLADSKEHSVSPFALKLLGMTMEINGMEKKLVYPWKESGVYTMDDIAYATFTFHFLAKGKVFRWLMHTDSAIDMDTYIEVYPVEIEYLTVEEYKELRSDKSQLPFERPLNLQPLPPTVDSLIRRVERQ